jgi:hypothetical protein
VDEVSMTFTHDRVIDAFLPGVAPTGRPVELLVVAIVGFRDGKIDYEHLSWDQGSLLVHIVAGPGGCGGVARRVGGPPEGKHRVPGVRVVGGRRSVTVAFGPRPGMSRVLRGLRA